jgi:hypothetical protein
VDVNSQERYVAQRHSTEHISDRTSKEFVLGFGDAFQGIVRHPYLGAKQEGVLGLGKGVGRGMGGFFFHSMAGM